jgi:type I restriction enzyme, S subunit
MKKDWIEVDLGEVLKTTSGGTPSRRNPDYYSGTIPWVKSGELNQNTILDTEEKISEDALKNSSAKKFPKGTLLIALYGATIGKLAFLGIEAATNQAVCGIYKNDAIESRFLYYFLFHNRRKLVEQGAGGAQPNISQTILKNLPIVIAPLPEQRAIVARIEELFSELDHSIANLKSAQAKLEIYRQAVLKKAFDGGFSEGSIAFRNVELKNLVIKISDGPFGSNLKTADYTNDGVRVIRLENIGFNQFRDEYKTFVSHEKYESIKSHTVGNGDIIFSSFISEMVRAVILPNHIDKAINKADCFLVRVNEFSIRRKYLTYYFLTKDFYNQLVDQVHGATRPRINTTQLKSSIIPLCELIEQDFIVQEIESRLSEADKLAETIQINLLKSESLRQSILKQAFEGKLLSEAELEACRTEADWEPAEKLLERIKNEKSKIKKK